MAFPKLPLVSLHLLVLCVTVLSSEFELLSWLDSGPQLLAPSYPVADSPKPHHHHHHHHHKTAQGPVQMPPIKEVPVKSQPPSQIPVKPLPPPSQVPVTPLPPSQVPVKPLPPPSQVPVEPQPPTQVPVKPQPPIQVPVVKPQPPSQVPVKPQPPSQVPVKPQPPSQVPVVKPQPPIQAPVKPQPPSQAPVKPQPPSQAPVKPQPPSQAPVKPVPKRSLVAVQGVVYCKSCKFSGIDTLLGAAPLVGANVELHCNNTKIPTVQLTKTDKNGYFFMLAQNSLTTFGAHKCNVKLGLSNNPKCNKPTNLHYGVQGSKLFPQKEPNLPKGLLYELYSVGPFAYEPAIKCAA